MRFKLVGNQRVSPNADVSPSQLCAVCQGKLLLYYIFDLEQIAFMSILS